MDFLKSFFQSKTKLSGLPQPIVVKNLIQQFDVFYVCFDEPNRHENWEHILQLIPEAKKVEGVVGFDNALKTCAKRSQTDYFFLIDGENKLIADRLEHPVEIPNIQGHWVLSWSSLNQVNGLVYGNGGLKLWPKQVAIEIRAHENASDEDDQTDYCFIAEYCLVDDYVSETIINSTPTQAFRAGFREGVKMSLVHGKQVELNKENFNQTLASQNRMRLKAWCELGNDSLHGCWSILGARLGLKKNALEKFDCKSVNSYEWIDQYFITLVLPELGLNIEEIISLEWSREKLKSFSKTLGEELNQELPLGLREIPPIESLQIKRDLKNPSRKGLLGRAPRP